MPLTPPSTQTHHPTFLSSPLLQRLYALPAPSLKRDLHRPLQVLALGISRCGTDSLRQALATLGYNGVYHGIFKTGAESQLWTQWWDAKAADPLLKISREEFDRVLGLCEAVTDAPGAMFGEDLVRAYPGAKIILNRRSNPAQWDRSMRATLVPVMRDSYLFNTLAFFSGDAFWVWQITQRFWDDLFEGRFESCSQRIYSRHFERLEQLLREEGREWLDWVPEHGWEPLCAFLGKNVPEDAFPRSNGVVAFHENLRKRRQVYFWSALGWMGLLLGIVSALVLLVGMKAYRILGQVL